MWTTPSAACVWSHAKHEPPATNGPSGVGEISGLAIPTPAGTRFGFPSKKIVRRAWMWKRVCSLCWHAMPSTEAPGNGPPAAARFAPPSSGTVSGPADPSGGAETSLPSVDSGARWPEAALEPPPPKASPRPIPTATSTTSAAPAAVSALRDKRKLDPAPPPFERTGGGVRFAASFRCCLARLPLGIREDRRSGAGEECRSDRLCRRRVWRLADHRRGPLEPRERLPQRVGAQRPVAVGQVLRL